MLNLKNNHNDNIDTSNNNNNNNNNNGNNTIIIMIIITRMEKVKKSDNDITISKYINWGSIPHGKNHHEP